MSVGRGKGVPKKCLTLLGVPPRFAPPKLSEYGEGRRPVAGVDEAGRGPWAGPVVAAAVIIERWDFTVRIDDSKRLSPRQRERAYHEIRARARVGVGLASHALIDRINILQATRQAMHEALARLGRRPDVVLVDGRIPPLGIEGQINLDGGDGRSLSIACASIVAKVVRDRIMRVYERQYPGYAFAQHKGYGAPDHIAALRRLGPCPIHRRSFAPIRRLLASGQPALAR